MRGIHARDQSSGENETISFATSMMRLGSPLQRFFRPSAHTTTSLAKAYICAGNCILGYTSQPRSGNLEPKRSLEVGAPVLHDFC